MKDYIEIPKLHNEKAIGYKGYRGKLVYIMPANGVIGCYYAVSIFHDKPHTKHHIFRTFDTYESAKDYYKRWISNLDAWANTLKN